ncbi:SDR family oxidoreductase [Bacillus horti]|uniref:NAD(P)-dependent dehydrogenase (Short-subunit alcohol dehydrogenase family) n=2 Tax=Caldalkalibacillus horti TaxID=77523 RepID=A0ABT9VU27_9BACI|nr:SDR family oxidoreductase [Bacillus horti]MDQ0164485.1 NAD(P)-dependent dehydrogenase (short-subunit alcohol dehydrogenase family) [Bacillus horti]
MEQKQQATVLITGTSSGFGLHTTIALAKQGFQVVATMRDLERKQELLSLAEQEGALQQIELLELDVTDSMQVNQVVETILKRYGSIDILINNAGFAQGGYVEEIPLDRWQKQFDTNFFGLIQVTQAVLPSMRERGSGRIINMSSISGLIAFPSLAPYAASKFAVEAFSEALRLEMLPYGIYVSLIEPGSYRTKIWDKGLSSATTLGPSMYQQEMNILTKMIQQKGQSAPHPEPVIRTILQVIRSKRPKLRYPIGRGVRSTIWLKKLVPWSLIEKGFIKQLNKDKKKK